MRGWPEARGLEPGRHLARPALLVAQRERMEDVRALGVVLLELAADAAGRAHQLLGLPHGSIISRRVARNALTQ